MLASLIYLASLFHLLTSPTSCPFFTYLVCLVAYLHCLFVACFCCLFVILVPHMLTLCAYSCMLCPPCVLVLFAHFVIYFACYFTTYSCLIYCCHLFLPTLACFATCFCLLCLLYLFRDLFMLACACFVAYFISCFITCFVTYFYHGRFYKYFAYFCVLRRLLAYLIIILFKFQARPPFLVFLPFFICVRGGA